ncbi:hypothetical protein [Candidatus Amarolinea aalborgensis]|uniref:hypothetical protein n=1 Tax=Candidatus Amarolinea aalborgensis TaxID=2249329 RepID=UPI003BF9667D
MQREFDVALGKDVEAEGAALRALHIFLREVDKTRPALVRPAKGGYQRRQHRVGVRRKYSVP